MNKLNYTLMAFALLVAGSMTFTSCSSCNEKANTVASDAANTAEDAANSAADAANSAADAASDAANNAADAASNAADDTLDKMDVADAELNFSEGSWAWNIQQYLNGGQGSGSFELDKITVDKGEEISADGKEQLDNLAALLKANSAMTIDLKAHSREAKNAAGRTAKKAGTKARALWVQEKLKARGVDGKQINAIGAADSEMLEGVAGDDDSQRRLSVTFVK